MIATYFCCLLLILSAFGCQKSKQQPQEKRTDLRLSFKYNPITIDPRKNGDPLSCTLINMLYEGLVHLEPDGSCSLGLAKSIQVSKKNTRYTFHLKDAKWSNGKPITAYDFEASWKKILHPDFNSINAYFLYPIKNAKAAKMGIVSIDEIGIYVIDEKTFLVKLEHPNPYFLKMIAFSTYFPVWKESSDLTQKNLIESGVYSGPFILQEWKMNDSLVLRKNPNFWNADEVHLEKISINIIPDENTNLKLHQLNQIDWLGSFFSPIPQDAISSTLELNESFSANYAGTSSCFFNVNSFPFNNVNIRKAFAYAIDKDEIVKHICQNQPIKAYGITPPVLVNNERTKFIPDSSPELAKHYFEQGLKELGLSVNQFPKLVFSFYTSDLDKTIALSLQQQWKKNLGISISLEQLEVKIFLDKLYKRNYQFCLMSIVAQYFDPMNFLERFIDADGVKNFSSWENPYYKHLIEISSETTKNQERLAILKQAEMLLMEEMPVAPIYHLTLTYLKHPQIEGVEISPIGSVDFRHAYFKINTKKNN